MKTIMGEKKNKNLILNALIVLLIGSIAIFLVLKSDYHTIFNILKSIRYEYILICILIVFLWQFLIGLSLTIFSKTIKKDYKFSQGFLNALVAALFNGITPSSTGGQIAQTFVFRKQGIDTLDALSILWMEFLMYQLTMCFFSLFLILIRLKFFLSEYSNLFLFVIFGFILNFSIALGTYLLGRSNKVQEFILNKGIHIAYKFHFIKNLDETKIKLEEKINKFRDDCNKLHDNKKEFFICVILCILRLSCYYLVPYIIFIGLGNKFSFELLIDSIAMASFVAIVSNLVPIPGASGGSELIFILMFGHLFNDSSAKAAMILWRFFTYYFVMLVGCLAYGYYRFRGNDNEDRSIY